MFARPSSVRLLTKKRFLLLLGALTTIFAIAIDPFTQQLVQFEEKSTEVESFDVMIPRATRYTKGWVYTDYSNNDTQGMLFIISGNELLLIEASQWSLVSTLIRRCRFCHTGCCVLWSHAFS